MALLGPIGQQQTVNQPFVWGQGGKRMTAEDIAMQRQLADQQRMTGSDFSPVGHWTQGLARASQGLIGGFNARNADRAADANAAESQSIAELLMGQGEAAPDNNAVLQALVNPYVSDEVRGLANMQYQQMNPEPQQPNDFERLLLGAGIEPGSPEWQQLNLQNAQNRADPMTTAAVGDVFFSGRSSQLPALLGEAGLQQIGQPAAPVGRLTPIEPTMGNTPSPEMAGNGMPQSLSAAQYQAVVNQMGRQATDEWIARNNIPVGN